MPLIGSQFLVLGSRLPVLIPMALVGAVLGCAYAYTLAPGVTWANDGADSGDLVAAFGHTPPVLSCE